MSAHAGTSAPLRGRPGRARGPLEARGVRAAVASTAVGAAGFAALLVLVALRWAPLARLDTSTVATLTGWLGPHAVLVDVFVRVQQLSQPWVLRAVAVIVAALLIRRGRRRLGAWLVGVAALGTFLEWFLKVAIGRPRPLVAVPIEHVRGFSFPSGHALTSALVVGALLVVIGQLGASRRLRITAWTVGLLIVGLVGFDRLVLGPHYVSDVVAGWFVAVCVLGGTVLAFGIGHRRSRPRRRGSRSRRNVAVVVNPSKVESGFRGLVEREATRTGWNAPLWLETTPDDPGHAMVRAALDAQVDLVIAAGGDGTVRVVCAGLAGTDIPVGIVPLGTGNLLVRNLSLPLDRHAAIRTAFTGQNRVLDLVKVDGDGLGPDRFAVMAGLGLDAAVVGEALPQLKARMGWGAYAVSMARNLSFPAVRVDITVDDAPTLRRWVRTV
ncbi:MAG TPA: diacylglycerol kinase family protein, partial [Actinopolymorphaceae bacterium]|nr:diacylglycerol kinase family protein [Actinopolymorphaceae bacterium]